MAREMMVRLAVTRPVEIKQGLVLPPGTYDGISRRTRVATQDGVTWTEPEYRVDVQKDLMSLDYDVTKFVRAGDILVR